MSSLINVIGAGNLGKTIAYLLAQQHELIMMGALCNRSKISTQEAIQFVGSGSYCASIRDLPAADVTLIATPDDLIAQVCIELAQSPSLKPNSIIFHCSGSLSSEALHAVRAKGCWLASIHPMRSFANPTLSVRDFQGTYCAMEGDGQALAVLQPFFERIGAITYVIDKNKKSLYHAAGVFSSNYLVTLAHQARTCLQEAGVPNEIAMQIIISLMKGSIFNLEHTLSPQLSLTGPLQRGDISTVKQHIDSFESMEQKSLYAALGKATLALITQEQEYLKQIQQIFDTIS